MERGTLYLIPTIIAENTSQNVLASQVLEVLSNTQYFVAETLRETRRFISGLKLGLVIENLDFKQHNKNSTIKDARACLTPALQGHNIGVLSDAGCPGIADPGAQLVQIAHQLGIKVVPLVGPSSLVLALMASGFNGQSFAFNGYLPIETKEAKQALQRYEKHAAATHQTQLFIETPYRSDRTLKILTETLHPHTHLCVAANITGANELIKTKAVGAWRKSMPKLGKVPVVFLFLP